MKQQFADKDRKEIESKMATVFMKKMSKLPTELREILIDDMVTAFENRLKVLKTVAEKADN